MGKADFVPEILSKLRIAGKFLIPIGLPAPLRIAGVGQYCRRAPTISGNRHIGKRLQLQAGDDRVSNGNTLKQRAWLLAIPLARFWHFRATAPRRNRPFIKTAEIG